MLLRVAPDASAYDMPTLSDRSAVMVIVLDCDVVVRATEEADTARSDMTGSSSSDLVTVNDIDEELLFPAASDAVKVRVVDVSPKEYDPYANV